MHPRSSTDTADEPAALSRPIRMPQASPQNPPPPQYDYYHPEQAQPYFESTFTSNSIMERVLFQLHVRSCQFGLRALSSRTRRLLEQLWLVLAIAGFGALIVLHRQFVYKIGSEGTIQNCAATCLPGITGFTGTADLYHITILGVGDASGSGSGSGSGASACSTASGSYVLDTEAPSTSATQCAVEYKDDNLSIPPISYSFSTTKAYLLLPPGHALLQHHLLHNNHKSMIQHLVVSPNDPNCFGEPFFQFWFHHIMGYETLVWNWLVPLVQQQQKEGDGLVGWVLTHKTGRLQELQIPSVPQTAMAVNIGENHDDRDAATDSNDYHTSTSFWQPFVFSKQRRQQMVAGILSKVSVMIKTTFLFFFSTTLISFTLRETQERMLDFTQELSRRVSMQVPLVDLVVVHLLHNLVVFVPIMVGMMFFLIEFYSGDKVLAFLVMTIVWCVEVFSVISLRSSQGITFFPRMFFLLFCLFHIYYFANPYGFAYLALAVVASFMLHSMAFFWHRYELPAVAMGRVTIDRPRLLFPAEQPTSFTYYPAPFQRRQQQPQQQGIMMRMGTAATIALSPSRAMANEEPSGQPQQQPVLGPPSPPRIRSRSSPPGQQQQRQQDADDDPLDFDPITTTNNTNTTRTLVAPSLGLPPQSGFGRQSSSSHHASFSSTTSSRNSSSGGIFHNTDDDDGDGDSSSYMYFMQGEVVLHRRPNGGGTTTVPSSSSYTATQPAAWLSTVESTHTLSSTTSGQDGGAHLPAPPRQDMSAAVGLDADNMFGDDDEPEDEGDGALTSHQRKPAMTIECSSPERQREIWMQQRKQNSHQNPTTSGQQQEEEDCNNKSGLQAILEVRLTPRHRNHATRAQAELRQDPFSTSSSSTAATAESCARESTCTSSNKRPPIFPHLPSSS